MAWRTTGRHPKPAANQHATAAHCVLGRARAPWGSYGVAGCSLHGGACCAVLQHDVLYCAAAAALHGRMPMTDLARK